VSYTYIKSPISGQLASRLADPGQVVAAGQPIADVVNVASVYFKGEVSEKELLGIRNGQAVDVRVDAAPNRVFRGNVAEIYPSGSTQSRNFPVRIKIDRTDHIVKPGMFARGSIITGVDRGVLLVPKDAIEERRGTKMVFVLQPNNTVRREDLTVVQENREHVEAGRGSGLAAGDVVVTRGRQNLQDKSLVKVESRKSKVESQEPRRLASSGF
jgi:RND family efflux transporter MFP subunit